jgi:hypothetical protein
MEYIIQRYDTYSRGIRPFRGGGVDEQEYPPVNDRPTPEQLSERLAPFWKQASPGNGGGKFPNDPPKPVYSSLGERWPSEEAAAKDLGLTKTQLQHIIIRPLGYKGVIYDHIPVTPKARDVLVGNAGGKRKPGLDKDGRVRKSRAKYFHKAKKHGNENRQGG